MSWRAILGIEPVIAIGATQNTHNTQNSGSDGSSAYCGYFEGLDDEEKLSKLLELLTEVCVGLDISPLEVRRAFAPADLTDIWQGRMDRDALAAFANALRQRRDMDQGKRPDHYRSVAVCKQCGPIWLWTTDQVRGCPWCWNRLADKPIPRPQQVRCGDCARFRRTDHPFLGHCAVGQWEPRVGLVDSDSRDCERYVPEGSGMP